MIASRSSTNGALEIHQDVDLYTALLETGEEARLDLRPGRHAWVQVIRGSVSLNGHDMAEGDGAAVSEEEALMLTATSESEVLVFDLG